MIRYALIVLGVVMVVLAAMLAHEGLWYNAVPDALFGIALGWSAWASLRYDAHLAMAGAGAEERHAHAEERHAHELELVAREEPQAPPVSDPEPRRAPAAPAAAAPPISTPAPPRPTHGKGSGRGKKSKRRR